MKKLLLIVLAIVMVIALISCDRDENEIRIDDINVFKNKEYISEDYDNYDLWWKTTAGQCASNFFPPYEEIKYNYSDINFYVYAHADFIAYPDATFVLELVFDNEIDYQNAKKDIYSTYDFLKEPVKREMPACEYVIGEFTVKILTEGEEDNFPHQVYAICENDKAYTIRYLTVYDEDMDIMRKSHFKNGVEKYSNCKW